MIFVTVGPQEPFDRLVRVVDEWAANKGPTDVVAQIASNSWRPPHLRWVEYLSPDAFRRHLLEAELVVAHAGTGTILQAMELTLPLVIVPRRACLRETRNDHQLGTARRLAATANISVAYDEQRLVPYLNDPGRAARAAALRHTASPELLDAIRGFLRDGTGAATGKGCNTSAPWSPARRGVG